ncbi:MAG: hypothetical protein ACRD1T_07470, partial [Acidimicrobiia bacterium]
MERLGNHVLRFMKRLRDGVAAPSRPDAVMTFTDSSLLQLRRTWATLLSVALLLVMLPFSPLGTQDASAAPAFATQLGTATNNTSASISTSMTPFTVGANRTLIVAASIARSPASLACGTGNFSATDGTNPLTVDVAAASSGGTDPNNACTAIFSRHYTSATSVTVAVTHPSTNRAILSASEYTGVLSASPRDQTNSSSGTGTSTSTGAITPTQNNELLIGAVGIHSGGAVTPTHSWSNMAQTAVITTIGGNPRFGLHVGYNVQGTAGAFTGTGTATNQAAWAAAIVSYKEADPVAPTVTSINLADASPTSASTVNFTVAFSESVTGVDAADFALTGTATAGASISGVTGSGSSYNVAVSTGSGSGTLGLDLVDDNSISDSAGNLLGGPLVADGNFTGQQYTMDKTAPVVLVTAPATDATVNNTGTTGVTFTADEAGNYTIMSGTCAGGTVLKSSTSYPVANTSTPTTFNNSALDEGANTIRVCVTDSLGNTGSNTAAGTITKDSAAPTVLSINRQSPTGQNTNGTSVTYR